MFACRRGRPANKWDQYLNSFAKHHFQEASWLEGLLRVTVQDCMELRCASFASCTTRLERAEAGNCRSQQLHIWLASDGQAAPMGGLPSAGLVLDLTCSNQQVDSKRAVLELPVTLLDSLAHSKGRASWAAIQKHADVRASVTFSAD